jgi:predicted NBD/HSP70 family sugar kinase
MQRGSNLPAVASFNQAVVLDGIRRSPDGSTRTQLTQSTGLSAQTVSNVSRRLLSAGLVRETGKRVAGLGKPATILQIDPHGAYAVGVHLDPAVITTVLLDLAGGIVGDSRVAAPASGDAHETIETSARAVAALVAEAGVPAARIRGLGVAAPGPIDAERGMMTRPPLAPKWRSFPVRDELGAAAGLPALIAKDTVAAAVAEQWMNPGRSDNYACVYYGTGVGVGLVLDGHVYVGSSSNAGDVGHVTVDENGPLCNCGLRGCYGEVVRPLRLVERAISLGAFPRPAGELDYDVVDELFTRLIAAGARGEPAAAAVLDESLNATARYMINVANLLDIDRVVFGGPFFAKIESDYLARLPARMEELTMSNLIHPIALSASVVGEDVAAVGAACLVLDGAFSAHPSQLLIG